MKAIPYLLALVISVSSLTASAQNDTTAVSTGKKKQAAKAPKTYTVYEKGPRVSKMVISKDAKGAGNIIIIDAVNVTGGSILMGRDAPVLPPPDVTQIESLNGSYANTRTSTKTGRSLTMQLLEVVFPYRARVTISEQIVDFEITEPGYWKVSIGLSQ